jgi:hypothetical protein
MANIREGRVIRLPERYSKKWFVILVAMFVFTFAFLIIFKLILQADISQRNIMGFALMSSLASLIITIGGYLGFKAYFYILFSSNIAGILYMLYLAVNRSAAGWTDLVAVMAYMFIMGIGVLIGITVQLVLYFVKKSQQ